MATSIIHPDTTLGYVHLTVSKLDRSLDYYQRALGFQLHRREGKTAYLGAGQADLLALTENSAARYVPRRTGLYHFAILTPSRVALAQSLRNLIETKTEVGGGSDHLVSEALYLSDPDGNGIEIYRDRPRGEWPFQNGSLQMATDPLDYHGILGELAAAPAPWSGLHPDTVLGHMHLHVSDLGAAESFYQQVIGFGLMQHYGGSASFLSAGGYHHHLGVNTWNGVGAPPPPENAVGLRYFVVNLPNQAEQDALITRLGQAEVAYDLREDGLAVRDPSQNEVVLRVA